MVRSVYDEAGHAHFVTFSCCKRRNLLDEPAPRSIVVHWLQRQLTHRHGECAGFVIMPNHVHAIVRFPEPCLSLFMQQWKRLSSHGLRLHLNERRPAYAGTFSASPVWQPHFYDFNLVNDHKLHEKLEYMHHNPVRAGLVQDPCDWQHSSARWYMRGRSVGVRLTAFV